MAEQNSAPTRKVGVGLIAGAMTTVIVSVAKDAFGYSMSPDLAAAVTTIISFLASYFTPNATPQERDP